MPRMSTANLDNLLEKRVDLHSHTNCSDGGLSPETLVDRAVNFQLDVLAITDHDTVSALDIAQSYIDDNQLPLTLVPGIEISTLWQNFEIHVVGLNIDSKNQALSELIASQQNSRDERAKEIGIKLEKCGLSGVYEQALLRAGEGSVTRAHFAKVMVEQGHVSKMQAAFDKYIGKGKRAYVKPKWCSIADAVSTIHKAGGVAVLAHPIRYDLSAKWLRRLIVDFSEASGDGLEIVLPQMNNEQRQRMLNYCQEYQLLASLGSDFHYPSKWSDLGRNLKLPNNCEPIWSAWH
ncbi:RNase RNM [Thalassotalea fusca]